MTRAEREVEAAIFKHCHAAEGHWVMRSGVQNQPACNVFDLARSVPKPGGDRWERIAPTVASGANWVEVLADLDGLVCRRIATEERRVEAEWQSLYPAANDQERFLLRCLETPCPRPCATDSALCAGHRDSAAQVASC